MYQCAQGHVSEPGQKQVLVVVEYRDKVYYEQQGRTLVEVGRGREIAREIRLCPKHANALPPIL